MTHRKFVWSVSVFLTLSFAAASARAADEPISPRPLLSVPAPMRPAALSPLYVSYSALQIADVATTLHNVNNGGRELNPLMRGVVNSPGAFIATKAALATVSIYCTEKLWKRNRAAAIALMVGLNGLSATVVARNYATRTGR